jgi:hypothetical protein
MGDLHDIHYNSLRAEYYFSNKTDTIYADLRSGRSMLKETIENRTTAKKTIRGVTITLQKDSKREDRAIII